MKRKIETLKKIRSPKLTKVEDDWLKQHNATRQKDCINVVCRDPNENDRQIAKEIDQKVKDLKVVWLVPGNKNS